MNQSLTPLLAMHSSACVAWRSTHHNILDSFPLQRPCLIFFVNACCRMETKHFCKHLKKQVVSLVLICLWMTGAWGLDKLRWSLNRKQCRKVLHTCNKRFRKESVMDIMGLLLFFSLGSPSGKLWHFVELPHLKTLLCISIPECEMI